MNFAAPREDTLDSSVPNSDAYSLSVGKELRPMALGTSRQLGAELIRN